MKKEENLQQPTKIRYKYDLDPNAKLNVAHGIWGGINPHGEIELNFYHESDTMPTESECNFGEDGIIGPEVLKGREANVKRITRHIHSRVLLNYQTACAILEWLGDHVAILEMDEGNSMPMRDIGPRQ